MILSVNSCRVEGKGKKRGREEGEKDKARNSVQYRREGDVLLASLLSKMRWFAFI